MPSGLSHATLYFLPAAPFAADPTRLRELTEATGVSEYDLRQRGANGRPAALARSTDMGRLLALRDRLVALGHGAVVVADDEVRRLPYPLACRRVTVEESRLGFQDEDGAELASMPRGAPALVIVANLGGAPERPPVDSRRSSAPTVSRAAWPAAEQCLEELLTHDLDAIVVEVSWGPGGERVRIGSGRFNFASLGSLAGPGVTVNMHRLLGEILDRSAPPLLDLGHGHFEPPRIAGYGPDLSDGRPHDRPRTEAERDFENYCRHLHAVWRKNLFAPVLSRPPGREQRFFVTPTLAGAAPAESTGEGGGAAVGLGSAEPDSGPGQAPSELASPVAALFRHPRPRPGTGWWTWAPPAVMAPLLLAAGAALIAWLRLRSATATAWAALTAGLVALAGGMTLLARRRRIQNVPTSLIRSAAMGLCEVHGKARPLAPLLTPFSQMPCVYYEYRLVTSDEPGDPGLPGPSLWWRGSSGEGRRRLTVTTGSSGRLPFLVADGTGEVEVDPEGAIVEVSSAQKLNHLPFDNPGLSLPGWLVEVEERYIPVDYDLYVMGELKVVGELPATGDAGVTEACRAFKADRRKMAASDANHDGVVDGMEWEAARLDLERECLRERLRARGRSDRLVIGRPGVSDLFFISEKSEKNIVRSLGVHMWLALATGAFLVLASALYLVGRPGGGR